MTQASNPEPAQAVTGPLPLSPLQLSSHAFTNVRVKVNQDGDAAAEPLLNPTLWFDRAPDSANHWRLVLTLKLASVDHTKPFLYDIDVQIQGTVQVASELPEDRKEQLALVNGFSLLFGAAREMLLNITARSLGGAISLPTLSFVDLVAQARKKRAEALAAAAPKATETNQTS